VKPGPTRNLSASVRTRLLSLAQDGGEDYQRVLGRYAIERFLYRLGRSKYRDKFALKGATLFTLWTGQTHRPTKDLDLLGRGLSSTITEIEALIREICEIRQDDGIIFDDKSIEGSRIKEEDEYDGVRVKFQAELAGARIPMQVDIGFGDAVYPEPELASFPVLLLPMEAPIIRAYPRQATIAERMRNWDSKKAELSDDPDVAELQKQVDVPRPMAEQAVKERRRRAIAEMLPSTKKVQ